MNPLTDELDAKLSHIHALVKHLLNVPEERATEIAIRVHPLAQGYWQVQVSHSGFSLGAQAEKLSEATSKVLEQLTSAVSKHLEEGSKLISKT